MKINIKKQRLSRKILSCRYRIENFKRRRLKVEDVVQFTVGHISEPKPGIIVRRGQAVWPRLKNKIRYGAVGDGDEKAHSSWVTNFRSQS